MTDIQTIKRLEVETDATLGGLLELIGRLPVEVPHEARITQSWQFGDIEDHDEDAHIDPDFEPEITQKLVIALEWDA